MNYIVQFSVYYDCEKMDSCHSSLSKDTGQQISGRSRNRQDRQNSLIVSKDDTLTYDTSHDVTMT